MTLNSCMFCIPNSRIMYRYMYRYIELCIDICIDIMDVVCVCVPMCVCKLLLPRIKNTWTTWFTIDFLIISPNAIKMHQK